MFVYHGDWSELQSALSSPLLCCTFAMSNWILDVDNSQANDLSLQNLFSVRSHNDEIFHGSVSSSSYMGSIASV